MILKYLIQVHRFFLHQKENVLPTELLSPFTSRKYFMPSRPLKRTQILLLICPGITPSIPQSRRTCLILHVPRVAFSFSREFTFVPCFVSARDARDFFMRNVWTFSRKIRCKLVVAEITHCD